MNELNICLQKKGFLIQGKRGGAWAPLGVYLCTCLEPSVGKHEDTKQYTSLLKPPVCDHDST